MINLIKNELIKIFHKKVIYIMLVIMFIFVTLVTVISKTSSNAEISYNNYSPEYIDMLKSELENLDFNNPNELMSYIDIKTELDQIELLEKYGFNSWQAKIINDILYSYIYDLNVYEYDFSQSISLDNEEQLKLEYDELLKMLDSGDWKFFANKQLDENIETLEILENQKNGTNSDDIDLNIKRINIDIYLLNLRLENNIPYGYDYLNSAIETYRSSSNSLLELENNTSDSANYYYDVYSSSGEDNEYNKKLIIDDLNEDIALSQYILENKQDINNVYSLRALIINIFDNYELLIIVLIVIISGSIVSEEFNKGTIKLLLTRPYTRSQILLAKFITTIIIIFFAIISLVIMQFIIGLLLFGIQSLNIPAVIYNFSSNSIQTMSILKLLLIYTLAKLPLYILVSTIAFFISTIFSNTSIGITIALLGYMSTSIINTLIGLAYKNNIKFLKYFITMHWDFNQYLFGKLPSYEYISFPLSVIMCILYFSIMIIITFAVFQKKDIKNI